MFKAAVHYILLFSDLGVKLQVTYGRTLFNNWIFIVIVCTAYNDNKDSRDVTITGLMINHDKSPHS